MKGPKGPASPAVGAGRLENTAVFFWFFFSVFLGFFTPTKLRRGGGAHRARKLAAGLHSWSMDAGALQAGLEELGGGLRSGTKGWKSPWGGREGPGRAWVQGNGPSPGVTDAGEGPGADRVGRVPERRPGGGGGGTGLGGGPFGVRRGGCAGAWGGSSSKEGAAATLRGPVQAGRPGWPAGGRDEGRDPICPAPPWRAGEGWTGGDKAAGFDGLCAARRPSSLVAGVGRGVLCKTTGQGPRRARARGRIAAPNGKKKRPAGSWDRTPESTSDGADGALRSRRGTSGLGAGLAVRCGRCDLMAGIPTRSFVQRRRRRV